MGNKRYVVEITNNSETDQLVWVKRRGLEGIKASDMPGTSSEDFNKNYWEDIVHIHSEDPAKKRYPEIGFFSLDVHSQSLGLGYIEANTELALRSVGGFLEELNSNLPASAQILTGEVIESKPETPVLPQLGPKH